MCVWLIGCLMSVGIGWGPAPTPDVASPASSGRAAATPAGSGEAPAPAPAEGSEPWREEWARGRRPRPVRKGPERSGDAGEGRREAAGGGRAGELLIVRLVKRVDRLPLPPPPERRGRGRPQVYSDRLMLKALVIMVLRRLVKVHELLAVREEETP